MDGFVPMQLVYMEDHLGLHMARKLVFQRLYSSVDGEIISLVLAKLITPNVRRQQ
jgi:hypothetical protein